MRRRIPSTTALAVFESAARHESFTRAAEELAMTQSAVGRQVASLEDFLGLKLFRRTSRGVSLTPAGQRYGRQVALRLDEVERDTLDLVSTRGAGQVLELAAVPTFATRWLLPRLARFQASAGDITVNLTPQTRPFLFEGTPFDAAIHAGHGAWPGTRALLLMPEIMVAVCAPDLIPAGQALALADFGRCRLIQQTTRPYAWRQWFESLGAVCEYDVAGPRYELFSMSTQAAIHGMGIALIPRFLIEEEIRSGQLVVAHPQPFHSGNSYHLVFPEWKADHAALARFRDWVDEEAGAYRREAGWAAAALPLCGSAGGSAGGS